MERAVDKIMQYIDEAYTLEESDKEVLRFGIQAAMELTLNLLISIFILYRLHMMWEGLLFFAIFIPIRTLAGGYHSDTYLRCLLFSVLTLTGILVASNYMELPTGLLLVVILLLEGAVGRIAPVVNADRPVSKREYGIFKRRLKIVLLIDGIFSIFLWRMQCDKAVNIIASSLMLIVVTLILGRIKYKSYQISV